MTLKRLILGPFETNCYILVSDSLKAVLIDPGSEPEKITQVIKKNLLKPYFIIHTHGHIDHIGADRNFSLPIYIHKEDLPLLKDPVLNLSKFFTEPFTVNSEIFTLEDRQEIKLDEIRLKVIHTPGHTPGSICLSILDDKEKILFSGDTLFFSGIGRTDLVGASYRKLIDSIKTKLFLLDDDTVVYPGHGVKTTIGREKRENPFLKNG
ncbi:MAG: MBL fold metallo-hydrolase [Candidatus Omnitrophica bacterium]|nr:MBL fold metallo-hydrolase [Candidatus Omnitrophota bacterium]